ncbi:glomulin [Scaptodrosophila lebanonensis]|uniref:Glomulin n=1 Tax=Drosophila lebanonensis TaxID=7225 RepID=A0A6J2UC89_DROLE|nr:glomulin [Scaptodrosophila lebanonensis]
MEPVCEADAADNLLKLIRQLIVEEAYDGVKMLFYGPDPSKCAKNLHLMPAIAMDIYNEICFPSLNDEINSDDPELFDCSNELLKLLADYAPLEDLMLELMERIEESRSQAVFSAYIRALQVVLLRHGNQKPQALEWCLNSVFTRLQELPLPAYLSEGYDADQARLLEQDPKVEDLLAHYITVELFLEPLLTDVAVKDVPTGACQTFRDCSMSRRNILTCFLIQLLGKPLALLELSYVKKDMTVSYVQQIVKSLTEHVTQCIGDPYYLLGLVEKRARWQRKLDAAKGVFEMSSQNVFLIEEKLPLHALGMYYHALFVGNLLPPNAPKVYSSLFLLEAGIYLGAVLLEQTEPPLQFSGLRLIEHLVSELTVEIPEASLQMEVHKRFCMALCSIVGYSPQVPLRQLGLCVLRDYILSFGHSGKYFIIKNLLETLQHDGLMGYLSSMYKDLVNQALNQNETLPEVYHGAQFRSMLLLSVCCLPNDVKSDLLMNADRLNSALNIVRYFALRDTLNHTGFWNVMPEIEIKLLQPLGKALDFSLAHYKAYKDRVVNGQSASDDAMIKEQLNMLSMKITNSGVAGEGDSTMPDIGQKQKLEVLGSSITSLEQLLYLYLRTNECLEQSSRKRKQTEV